MKRTKLSVSFPIISEFYNSDTADYVWSSLCTTLNTNIKRRYLGEVNGDAQYLFYVGKLPNKKELLNLLRRSKKFESDAEILYFLKEETIDRFGLSR